MPANKSSSLRASDTKELRKARRTPPQIVFQQNPRDMRQWHGRLLLPSNCRDTRTGLPAEAALFNITENPRTGRCTVLVQGATPQGRRYVSYPDVSAAQAGGIRWAARRFRYIDP